MKYFLLFSIFLCNIAHANTKELMSIVTKNTSEEHIADEIRNFKDLENNLININETLKEDTKYKIIGDTLEDYVILNNLAFFSEEEMKKVYNYYTNKYKNSLHPSHVKYLKVDTAFVDKSTNYIFVGIKTQNEIIAYSNHYKILHYDYHNFKNSAYILDKHTIKNSVEYNSKDYYSYLKSLKSIFDIKHEKNHIEFSKENLSTSECLLVLQSDICKKIIINEYYKGLYSESMADLGAMYDLQTTYPLKELAGYALMARSYDRIKHNNTNDIHDSYFSICAFKLMPQENDKIKSIKKATYIGLIHKIIYSNKDMIFIDGNRDYIIATMNEILKKNNTPKLLISK